MKTIGAIATVQWVGTNSEFDGAMDPAIFVVGNDEDQLEQSAKDIHEALGHRDLEKFVVLEVTEAEWDIARRGQNINKGWFITDPDDIYHITKKEGDQ